MLRWVGRSMLSLLGGAVVFGSALWAVNDAQQVEQIRELERQRAELMQVIGRLKTTRRVAQLYVAAQEVDGRGRVARSSLEFREVDPNGTALAVRRCSVPGDVVYVDALVVRFTDDYVEKGDVLRGHSLHLFRRVFGEQQRPVDGDRLDAPNEIPGVYRTQLRPSSFERKLWKRFWHYAVNPEEAAVIGVRVAQGEAVYQRVRSGQLWELATQASGGLEFRAVAIDSMIQPHLSEPANQR
ncbi:MAG: hypothetical protein V3T70_11535 [Phycisphaerae bacterium]